MRQDELWRAGHRARTVHETLSRVLVQCVTTVPVHAGEDIGPRLLRRNERDLESCLGKGWWKKP
jgi:hypothetical protein